MAAVSGSRYVFIGRWEEVEVIWFLAYLNISLAACWIRWCPDSASLDGGVFAAQYCREASIMIQDNGCHTACPYYNSRPPFACAPPPFATLFPQGPLVMRPFVTMDNDYLIKGNGGIQAISFLHCFHFHHRDKWINSICQVSLIFSINIFTFLRSYSYYKISSVMMATPSTFINNKYIRGTTIMLQNTSETKV